MCVLAKHADKHRANDNGEKTPHIPKKVEAQHKEHRRKHKSQSACSRVPIVDAGTNEEMPTNRLNRMVTEHFLLMKTGRNYTKVAV
jgi:hypothetical protein